MKWLEMVFDDFAHALFNITEVFSKHFKGALTTLERSILIVIDVFVLTTAKFLGLVSLLVLLSAFLQSLSYLLDLVILALLLCSNRRFL